MAWLIEKEPEQSRLADEFRRLVSGGPILKIPAHMMECRQE